MGRQPDPRDLRPDLSRRQFLVRSAGLAGAFGIGVRGQGASEPSGPRGRMRIALVGCGRRGNQLLGHCLRHDSIDVSALVDIDRQALSRTGRRVDSSACRSTRSYSTLLDWAGSGELDAVIIATPPHRHADQAVEALEAGLHVYLEKPMALTVGDCRRVHAAAELAAARGKILQMGFQRRYDRRYQAGIQLLHSGEAGRLRLVRAQWHTQSHPAARGGWSSDRRRSGGLVLEQGCHQLDVLNWIFQAVPQRITGTAVPPPGHVTPSDTLDGYALVLEYPGPVSALTSHLGQSVAGGRFGGIYELAFAQKLCVDLTTGSVSSPDGRRETLEASPQNETRLAVDGFVDHALRGETPLADHRAGYAATVTAILAQEALATRAEVCWSERFEAMRDDERA